MSRETRPSNRQIAQNWIDWQKESKQAPPWDRWGWDWCDPSCMACGYWAESWDVTCRNCKTDDPCIFDKHMQSWNRAKGLHGCHIIPHAMGGLNEPCNFVLMCARCHAEAPDTRRPQVLYDWMRDRTAQLSAGIPFDMDDIRRIAQAALDANLTPQQASQRVKAAMADVSPHFGQTGARMSSGTAEYVITELSRKD